MDRTLQSEAVPRATVGGDLERRQELLKDSDLLPEKRYPHNIEMLRPLRDEGYPTACATMSHLRQVRCVLSVLDLDDAFDVVVTTDDVERGKPDP